MKKNRMTLAALAFAPFALNAQTLHESINVEGKYVPDIIRVDRLYTFPAAKRFPLESSPMAYDWKGVPAAFSPSLMTMPATGWRVDRDLIARHGYIEADLGSWLNSNLSAGGRFIDNGSTLLGAWLQFNSSSLEHADLDEATAERKRFRYDGTAGVYASHRFDEVGSLSAALSWHAGYFNYFSWLPSLEESVAPTQSLNDIALRLAWNSPTGKDILNWNVSAGMRWFGYRDLYLPSYADASGVASFSGIFGEMPCRETRLWLDGGLAMPWESGSEIGLNARFDGLLYSSQDDYRISPLTRLSAPDSYSMLTLTPYYRFSRGLLNIRIGADIDFAFDAGPRGSRYSLFHIAPDVKLDMQSGPVGVYLNLLGGSELQTLADLRENDYYQMPTLSSTRPVYSPLDGRFGLSFGPFAGFSAGLEFAYKFSRHTPMRGWYGYMLTGRDNPWASNPDYAGMTPLYDYDADGLNLHGFSLGLNLKYTTGRVFAISGDLRYQPQHGEKGYFNGYDRPRWVLSAEATLNPWRTLKFSVGYEYRGVRNIYTRMQEPLPAVSVKGEGRESIAALRLPDLTLLHAGLSYDFTPSFGVRVEAENLLDRHDARLPGLPGEGFSITGGVKILF